MEQFLQQYGLAILTVIIIAMMIIMATPIGSLIKANLTAVINNFVAAAQNAIDTGNWQTNSAAASANDLGNTLLK